jgi:Protein of unknown function (DUF3999)
MKMLSCSLKYTSFLRQIGLVFSATFICCGTAVAQKPGDFSARAEVIAPTGASVVRAVLPAASIAALRSANGGDLRVFNGNGLSLPHALIDASQEAQTRPDAPGARLPALPIYASTSTALNTPTLRIEEGPSGRVIEYSANPPAKTSQQTVRGLLFDARKIDGEVRAVVLEGALPAATIVTVSLDISSDLKTWRTLAADAPLFEFAAEGAGSATVAGPSNRRVLLPTSPTFKDQYLRLSWTGDAAPVITALQTVRVGAVKAAMPMAIDLGAPSSAANDAAEWTLNSGFRATGLRLQTSAANALMPVRILTRARAGDPWSSVASTVVYRLNGSDGAAGINASISLAGALSNQLRVEALRGYSLSGVPLTLALEYPPLQVLFVATGSGPFVIASGKSGVDTAALPVATLMPSYSAGAEFATPLLQATSMTVEATPRSAAQSAQDSLSNAFNRSTVLWTVLGLAVLVLGGLAVSLLRSHKSK